jgi:hypothetical protein
MILDWQLPIYIESMAIIADIEGMKALNAERADQGKALAYDEQSFIDRGNELRQLASDARP